MSNEKKPLQVAGWISVWRTSWGRLDFGIIEPEKQRAMKSMHDKNFVGYIYVSGTEGIEPENAQGIMPERPMTQEEKEKLEMQKREFKDYQYTNKFIFKPEDET